MIFFCLIVPKHNHFTNIKSNQNECPNPFDVIVVNVLKLNIGTLSTKILLNTMKNYIFYSFFIQLSLLTKVGKPNPT